MPTGFFATLVFSALFAPPSFAIDFRPSCGGKNSLTELSWNHEVFLGRAGDAEIETRLSLPSGVVSRFRTRGSIVDGRLEMPSAPSPIQTILNLSDDPFIFTCSEPAELKPGTGCFAEAVSCYRPSASRALRNLPRTLHGIHCDGSDFYANLSWRNEIAVSGNQVVISYFENGKPHSRVITRVRNGRLEVGSPYSALRHLVPVDTLTMEVYSARTLQRLQGPFVYDDFSCVKF